MVQCPASGEVRVWLVSVAEAMLVSSGFVAMLSQQERQRAERYLHQATHDEFVVARGCLRLLLGHVLRQDARTVQLSQAAHGKLRTEGAEFNVSHAHGLIAIAVSAAGPVGIDIEWEDRAVEALDVAGTVFTAEEIADLHGTPNTVEQRRMFFAMWTEMEAKAKCLGTGIAHLQEMRNHAGGFHVTRLTLPSGYQGALCLCEGRALVYEQFLSNEAIAWLLDCRYPS